MVKAALKTFIGFFSASFFLQAYALEPFSARFSVEALGMHLGYAEHRLRCEGSDCQLSSDAKPIGLARLLIGEQSHEVSTLVLSSSGLAWQGYENTIRSTRNNGIKDQFSLEHKADTQQIINPQRAEHWDYHPNTFDSLSMAYALQHRLAHQQPIETMILQEEKRQQTLNFSRQHTAYLNTEFKNQLETHPYIANTEDHRVAVWLAPELNFFPVQVEIYDKKRRRGMILYLTAMPTYP